MLPALFLLPLLEVLPCGSWGPGVAGDPGNSDPVPRMGMVTARAVV